MSDRSMLAVINTIFDESGCHATDITQSSWPMSKLSRDVFMRRPTSNALGGFGGAARRINAAADSFSPPSAASSATVCIRQTRALLSWLAVAKNTTPSPRVGENFTPRTQSACPSNVPHVSNVASAPADALAAANAEKSHTYILVRPSTHPTAMMYLYASPSPCNDDDGARAISTHNGPLAASNATAPLAVAALPPSSTLHTLTAPSSAHVNTTCTRTPTRTAHASRTGPLACAHDASTVGAQPSRVVAKKHHPLASPNTTPSPSSAHTAVTVVASALVVVADAPSPRTVRAIRAWRTSYTAHALPPAKKITSSSSSSSPCASPPTSRGANATADGARFVPTLT
mmetsp:Transcript_5375/g.17805  ORF Transcript_5375/g.17805 Transcript_5375/m.17805 type:complete len:344 (+) Transcript_5375:1563-2594(+)